MKNEDMTEFINKIAMDVTETEEAFIFNTIHEYCKGVYGMGDAMVIPKKLLFRALTCFKDEHYDEWKTLMGIGDKE